MRRAKRIALGVGPAWITSELYTIEAKVEKPVDLKVMRGPMLQTILEDRFKLKVRRESRDIPLLALTVAKGGPKMQPHQEGSCDPLPGVVLAGAGPRAMPPELPPPGKVFCGFVRTPGPETRPLSTRRHQTENGSGLTIEGFINEFMIRFVETTNIPVVDKTGITGKFDFRFEYAFSPEEIKRLVQRTGRLESDFDTSPTLYEALEDQLGLKVEKTKGPWPHLVIDHVERPSPN